MFLRKYFMGFVNLTTFSKFTVTSGDPGLSPWGAPTPKNAIIFQFFLENCLKMKEFRVPGGAHHWHPSLDPPMVTFSSGAKQIHAFENCPLFAKFNAPFIMLEIIALKLECVS